MRYASYPYVCGSSPPPATCSSPSHTVQETAWPSVPLLKAQSQPRLSSLSCSTSARYRPLCLSASRARGPQVHLPRVHAIFGGLLVGKHGCSSQTHHLTASNLGFSGSFSNNTNLISLLQSIQILKDFKVLRCIVPGFQLLQCPGHTSCTLQDENASRDLEKQV